MRPLVAILVATAWISINEFVRNQVVLAHQWSGHYATLGLTFPSAPINGAVWGIWALCFAVAIFFIARRFNLFETAALAWFMGFVLMWLVIGNMAVLPIGILPYAIPWSMAEALGTAYILKKLA